MPPGEEGLGCGGDPGELTLFYFFDHSVCYTALLYSYSLILPIYFIHIWHAFYKIKEK
jgi:hypothetical protein